MSGKENTDLYIAMALQVTVYVVQIHIQVVSTIEVECVPHPKRNWLLLSSILYAFRRIDFADYGFLAWKSQAENLFKKSLKASEHKAVWPIGFPG